MKECHSQVCVWNERTPRLPLYRRRANRRTETLLVSQIHDLTLTGPPEQLVYVQLKARQSGRMASIAPAIESGLPTTPQLLPGYTRDALVFLTRRVANTGGSCLAPSSGIPSDISHPRTSANEASALGGITDGSVVPEGSGWSAGDNGNGQGSHGTSYVDSRGLAMWPHAGVGARSSRMRQLKSEERRGRCARVLSSSTDSDDSEDESHTGTRADKMN